MKKTKITFALFFGNRGFFPGEVVAGARAELTKAVTDAGFNYICMEEDKTRYGAVETLAEGKQYARFLKENEGKYDGVILCLPNFGDENGAIAALQDAGVPILVQAYPDEIGLMDFAHRRDAMCGKFAICNLLRQADIPFTLTKKFVVHPSSKDFSEDLSYFASVCRVVKGMKRFNIGTMGARTTAFKTVRCDEIALQKKGINIETIDLSDVFARVEKVTPEKVQEKKAQILEITEFSGYPEEKLEIMAKVQSAFEDIVKEYDLNSIAVRCWNEFQTVLGIAPCTSLCLLNEAGIAAACEVDITNAIMMRALSLAADMPAMLLDYNNNYGDDPNKAILFHCGPIAESLLEGKGEITEHLMFRKSFGEGTGVGVNKGRIKAGNITFGSIKTENGKICGFVSEGKFTDEPIEEAFFGSGKVVEKENLNAVANYMAESGYKHHVSTTLGHHADSIFEAFTKYLKYDIVKL
ncbi:MAG: L-fucose/L-arabinose isomerase family protein [Clostridia bacterium]|nr:L-fucose/L-arabinose isomerase family protein [Clostridia bacterium]